MIVIAQPAIRYRARRAMTQLRRRSRRATGTSTHRTTTHCSLPLTLRSAAFRLWTLGLSNGLCGEPRQTKESNVTRTTRIAATVSRAHAGPITIRNRCGKFRSASPTARDHKSHGPLQEAPRPPPRIFDMSLLPNLRTTTHSEKRIPLARRGHHLKIRHHGIGALNSCNGQYAIARPRVRQHSLHVSLVSSRAWQQQRRHAKIKKSPGK